MSLERDVSTLRLEIEDSVQQGYVCVAATPRRSLEPMSGPSGRLHILRMRSGDARVRRLNERLQRLKEGVRSTIMGTIDRQHDYKEHESDAGIRRQDYLAEE